MRIQMFAEGLGIFIWKIHRCEDGSIPTITRRAQELGFQYVVIKIAQASIAYNVDLAGPLVDSLKAAGIRVFGWQSIKVTEPDEEARIACHRINLLGLDGFVFYPDENIHIEPEDLIGYLGHISSYSDGIPIGISSHRYPMNYPWFPWKECLPRIQMILPRIFWGHSDAPIQQLEESLRQYRRLTDLSIHPTAGIFEETGWKPSVEEIGAFRHAVIDKGLPSCNLWSWDSVGKIDRKMLEGFLSQDMIGEKAAPTLVNKLFSELNARNTENAVALYDPLAKISTANKVYLNRREIFDYFSSFFELSAHPIFDYEMIDDNGSIKFLKWSCYDEKRGLIKPPTLDTIIIQHGLITYHSSV